MEVTIQLDANDKQLELFGPRDYYLRLLRKSLEVQITARQNKLIITGREGNVKKAAEVVKRMKKQILRTHSLTTEDVNALIQLRDSEPAIERNEHIAVYSQGKTP